MADGQDDTVVAGPAGSRPSPTHKGRPAAPERTGAVIGRSRRLIRQSEEVRALTRATIRRSEHLHAVASALHRSAHAARIASRPQTRYAVIEATLDGAPTSAVVRRDGSVVVDRRLRTRLEVVTALGDTLATGGPAVVGGDPLTSVLTIVRSSDGIRSVTLAGRASPATG